MATSTTSGASGATGASGASGASGPSNPPADAPKTVEEAVARINNPPKPEPSQEEADKVKEKGMQGEGGPGYTTR